MSWILEAIEEAALARVGRGIWQNSKITLERHHSGFLRVFFVTPLLDDYGDNIAPGFSEAEILEAVALRLADDATDAADPDNGCGEPATYLAQRRAALAAAIRQLADKVEALPLPTS